MGKVLSSIFEVISVVLTIACIVSGIFFFAVMLDNLVFHWGWAMLIPFKLKLALSVPYIVLVYFGYRKNS